MYHQLLQPRQFITQTKILLMFVISIIIIFVICSGDTNPSVSEPRRTEIDANPVQIHNPMSAMAPGNT